MPRRFLLLAGILTATMLNAGGCRSCSSCHDYSPPVASCECTSCGTHRSGSASGGYASGTYVPQEAVEGDASGPTEDR
jgi:hypothetical protein